jgi:hypothetical protein
LSFRRIPGGFAAVERRADVPPAEFDTLKRHQAVVQALAARVRGILPVRFGALVEPEALEEAFEEREDDVRAAFAIVRDRVQFTWRTRGAPEGARPGRAPRQPGHRARGARPGESGTAYLRRLAREANPRPPAAFSKVREKLRPFVVTDRYEAAAGSMPMTLYQLVGRANAARYRSAAAKYAAASPVLTVSGPFPPFAFAAELL